MWASDSKLLVCCSLKALLLFAYAVFVTLSKQQLPGVSKVSHMLQACFRV